MSDELNTHPRTILNVTMYTIQNFWLFGVKLWILGGRIHNAILVGWKKKKKKKTACLVCWQSGDWLAKFPKSSLQFFIYLFIENCRNSWAERSDVTFAGRTAHSVAYARVVEELTGGRGWSPAVHGGRKTWAFFSSADQYSIDGSRLTFNLSGIAMGRCCILQSARAAAR